MNLRQYTGARPLLQMAAQGRTADLISGRFQTAPRRALSEKLTQGGQHPNRRRSGMAATLLRRGRAEIDNCRDEVQKPKIQHLLPCLTPQTWSFQTDNAPHQGCITAIPSNPSARDPTTHGISGNCLLGSPESLCGNRRQDSFSARSFPAVGTCLSVTSCSRRATAARPWRHSATLCLPLGGPRPHLQGSFFLPVQRSPWPCCSSQGRPAQQHPRRLEA